MADMKLINKIDHYSDEEVDEFFRTSSKIAEEKINCLSCANCCKTISPIIEEDEIRSLSETLGITTSELFTQYVEMDEDGDFVFKVQPCPMLNLSDNKCSIYENRPKACREYPHTNMKGIRGYLDILDKNYDFCPIVQEVVHSIDIALKHE